MPAALASSPHPSLRSIATRLLAGTLAREVLVLRRDGTVAVHLVAPDARPLLFLSHLPKGPRRDASWLDRLESAIDGMDASHLTHERIADQGVLIVRFDERTSLGLVRLRMRDESPALAAALVAEWPEVIDPTRGSGGPTGAPAEARLGPPFATDRRRLN